MREHEFKQFVVLEKAEKIQQVDYDSYYYQTNIVKYSFEIVYKHLISIHYHLRSIASSCLETWV